MRAVTTKTAFSEEEWARVVRAPLVAGMAMSLADPGGPIEATKESVASLKSATNPPSREQLLAEVALEVQSMAQARRNPLGGFKLTKDRPPREQLLEELEGAYRTVAAKGTSEELRAYGRWLVAAAQAAADAAKEGGFMGIGAVRVSEGEQTMLELISAMVAADDPANDDRGGEPPVTSG
jgi:hypothetical protein